VSFVFGSGSAAFRTLHDDSPLGCAHAPPPCSATLLQGQFKNGKLIQASRSCLAKRFQGGPPKRGKITYPAWSAEMSNWLVKMRSLFRVVKPGISISLRGHRSPSAPEIGAGVSFRDGPKDQTSDVQLHIGNLEIPGSRQRVPRNDGKQNYPLVSQAQARITHSLPPNL
jgi:hypothetical protein